MQGKERKGRYKRGKGNIRCKGRSGILRQKWKAGDEGKVQEKLGVEEWICFVYSSEGVI
jgi:hypothetical protein